METIYRWFSSLYGSNLAEHLRGWDEATAAYTKSDLFSIIGLLTLIISGAACVGYYYILNHPRWNRGWKWSIFLLSILLINFLIAFGICFTDHKSGNISSDISNVSFVDCLGFGLANSIISFGTFVLCSILIQCLSLINLGSRNCKYTPFNF